MSRMLAAVLGLALLLTGCSWRKAPETHTRWEYKLVHVTAEGHDRVGKGSLNFASVTPSTDELNKLGVQGWELATSYLELETAFPNFGNDKYVSGIQPNVRPQRLVLIFRRPVLE
jgi:hypothetical protein